MYSYNSFTQNVSVAVICTIHVPNLINPTLSFDYDFTPSVSDYSGFLVDTNNGIALNFVYVPTKASATLNLQGEITWFNFYLDSWSNYYGTVTISNIKINGVPITLADT